MEKIELGSTGILVSRLGLGTVKFGRNEGVKYPSSFSIPNDEQIIELLSIAKSLGINLIDTAPAYGNSEERLGTLLKGQRTQWKIISKVGEEFENGISTFSFTPDHFKYSLERTLRRLNTDYLDILLIHSNGNDLAILENDQLIKTLDDFKNQKLVHAIGASTKTAAGGIKALELLDICMATYTNNYTEEESVLDYALQHKKGIILKKVLSSGRAHDIEGALRFAFGHKGTHAAILGTISAKHLRQNTDICNKILLP